MLDVKTMQKAYMLRRRQREKLLVQEKLLSNAIIYMVTVNIEPWLGGVRECFLETGRFFHKIWAREQWFFSE